MWTLGGIFRCGSFFWCWPLGSKSDIHSAWLNVVQQSSQISRPMHPFSITNWRPHLLEWQGRWVGGVLGGGMTMVRHGMSGRRWIISPARAVARAKAEYSNHCQSGTLLQVTTKAGEPLTPTSLRILAHKSQLDDTPIVIYVLFKSLILLISKL